MAKLKNKGVWISTLVLIAITLGFQNCGTGFEAAPQLSLGSTTADGDGPNTSGNGGNTGGGSGNTPPPAAPKAYVLPTSVTPLYAASKLNWSFDDSAANTGFQSAVGNLAGQCETRRTNFLAVKKVVAVIKEEGNLPGDPNIEAMKPVKDGLDQLPNVAFCAYFAKTDAERATALKTVTDYIAEWEATYVGDGNPINDRFFGDLLMSADLVAPLLTAAQYQTMQRFAERMDSKEATFMGALNPATDERLRNNWMVHHRMLRFYASLFSNDTNRAASAASAINAEVLKQYSAPTGFKLSTCSNLAAIGAYGSYDLQQRDALFYHAFGLTSLVPLLRLSPALFTADAKARLQSAVDLLKPYVLAEKTHKEFTCTTVQFDRDRIAKDPGAASNWNPDSQSILYRHARLGLTGVSAWTTKYVTPTYHPWFKLYFTGKGDVLQ